MHITMNHYLLCVLTIGYLISGMPAPALLEQGGENHTSAIQPAEAARFLRFEAGMLPNKTQPLIGFGAAYQIEGESTLGFQAKLTAWKNVPGVRMSASQSYLGAARLSASVGKTKRQGPVDVSLYAGLAIDRIFLKSGGSDGGGISSVIELWAIFPYLDKYEISLGLEKLIPFTMPYYITNPFEIKFGFGVRL